MAEFLTWERTAQFLHVRVGHASVATAWARPERKLTVGATLTRDDREFGTAASDRVICNWSGETRHALKASE